MERPISVSVLGYPYWGVLVVAFPYFIHYLKKHLV